MNKVTDKNAEMLAIDISENKSITSEGYLICENVKISHTYPMDYGDGFFTKPPEELFSTYTMSSFEGKPITIDHPSVDVTAENWKDLAVGYIKNVRKDGAYLVCDLILMDKVAIEKVQSNELKEVSIGFTCVVDYVSKSYLKITGNHLALVTAGRAGVECAIFDKKGGSMSEKKEGSDNPVEASAESGKEYQKGFSDGQKGFLDSFFSVFKAEKVDSKAETPTKEAEKSVKSDAMVVSEVVTLEEIMLKIQVIDAKLDQLLGVENLTLDSINSAENKAETDKPAETEQKEVAKEVKVKNDAKEVHTWLPANTWAGSTNNENTLEAMQAKLKQGVK